MQPQVPNRALPGGPANPQATPQANHQTSPPSKAPPPRKASEAPQSGERPFATYYYPRGATRPTDWLRVGHAKTECGAILAATRQVLNARAWRAEVYDPLGFLLVRVSRKRGGISTEGTIHYPSSKWDLSS